MQPFEPRRFAFHGLRRRGDWRLKLYSVLYGPGPLDWQRFEPGLTLAEASLPAPAIVSGRPGVGFLIVHQGRTGNYTVLGWWDRENELPIRVFVNPGAHPGGWRPARANESVCVWDLEILWAEREAYVATVLGPAGSDVGGYLARVFETEPAGGAAGPDGIPDG